MPPTDPVLLGGADVGTVPFQGGDENGKIHGRSYRVEYYGYGRVLPAESKLEGDRSFGGRGGR